MKELLKKIYPLRLAPVSEDTDKAVGILCNELPFKVHEYKSGLEHNGWIVPQKWKPVKAEIRKDGKLIYDGMKHPLGVVSYGASFKGKVSLDELKKHLFYHPNLPDALVYHCDYFYKQWLRDWGLSAPYNLYKNLEDGVYEVDIQTIFEDGTMKVLDYSLEGEIEDTIILNAHNCHAAQANDDISGVVVAIEVIKRLQKRAARKYSYRVIIAPEHLGTVFYLAHMPENVAKTFKYAMFLEMLGNKNRFALQESFTGESLMDKAAHHYLKHNFPDYCGDKFRKIVGNDETVWEAPGYEVPCISLSRWQYQEYHSDLDNEDIIHEQMLQEAVETVLGILGILETNTKMKRHFNGLVALSNPKYDLYISTVDPSIRPAVPDEQIKWNYLMNCLIRYFDEKTTIFDVAIRHDLPYSKLYDYITRYRDKGLISFVD
jgi:aminopeptidase-like protein